MSMDGALERKRKRMRKSRANRFMDKE